MDLQEIIRKRLDLDIYLFKASHSTIQKPMNPTGMQEVKVFILSRILFQKVVKNKEPF
jgi:hypothetical protein